MTNKVNKPNETISDVSKASLVGILAIVLTQDMSHVAQLIRELDWGAFLGALSLLLLGALVRAYRWGCLVWALGIKASWLRLTQQYADRPVFVTDSRVGKRLPPGWSLKPFRKLWRLERTREETTAANE